MTTERMTNFFMRLAHDCADMSRGRRLKVGAVAVKDDEDVIGYGWNGTPTGWDNNCEDVDWCSAGGWLGPEEIEERWPYAGTYLDAEGNTMQGRYRLVTKPEVLHAESNVMAKVMKNGKSSKGATMFITHAPCLECSKLMYQGGITKVVYETDYRDTTGIDFLRRCGVEVCKA
jgi:dCMP deaminase